MNKRSRSSAGVIPKKRGMMIIYKKKSKKSWDQLPDDVLLLITDRLSRNPADYVRFGTVCKSWHTVAIKDNYPLARQMPLLILAEDKDKDNFPFENIPSKFRRIYNHSEDKMIKIRLPQAQKRKCVGSMGGWVVTVGDDLKIQLLNPVTRVQIQLPSLDKLPYYFYERRSFIEKVCLSSNGKKLTALAIYDRGYSLAFSRLGDRSWTRISGRWCSPIMDAVFYKGQFYVVDRRRDVLVLDSTRCETNKITSVSDQNIYRAYVVESMGDLLVVTRLERQRFTYSTERFLVYKLVNARLEPVTSLGNRSLFVGLNNSFSVAATEMKGCRRNCIYFTDHDTMDRGYIGGVFNMKDNSIEPHFRGKSMSTYSPPLWIEHLRCFPELWEDGK